MYCCDDPQLQRKVGCILVYFFYQELADIHLARVGTWKAPHPDLQAQGIAQ